MEQERWEKEQAKTEDGKEAPVEQNETGQAEPEAELMVQTSPLVFTVKLTAKDLWKFSLYHSNKGMLGIFNVIFSLAAIFLLVTTWRSNTVMYRALLIVCALMFTVWQPFLLYLKAAKQSKRPVIQNPMDLSFSREGIVVTQGTERLELIWENIGRVERIRGMIIVYMGKVRAYLLPDTITGEKKEELLDLFRESLPAERRKKI